MKFCLTNARHLGCDVDLHIEDGKVVTMTPAGRIPPAGDEAVEDAQGLVLLPGLTDCHVHLREPGFEWKDDIASGLEAAAHGGFKSPLSRKKQSIHSDGLFFAFRLCFL